MTMTNEEKYEKNYQGFMKELTRISKKYGIGINACGCFDYYDLNGFKDIEYYKVAILESQELSIVMVQKQNYKE